MSPMRIIFASLIVALMCQRVIAAPVPMHQDGIAVELRATYTRSEGPSAPAGKSHRTVIRRSEIPLRGTDNALSLRGEHDAGRLFFPLGRRAIFTEEEKRLPGRAFVTASIVPDGTTVVTSRTAFVDGQEADTQDPRWRPGKWSYLAGGLGAVAVGVTAQQLIKKIINEQKKHKKEAKTNQQGGGGAPKDQPSDVPGKPGRQNRRDLLIDDSDDGRLHVRQEQAEKLRQREGDSKPLPTSDPRFHH